MYRVLVLRVQSVLLMFHTHWEENVGVMTSSIQSSEVLKACCAFWSSLEDRNCNQVFLSCFSYWNTGIGEEKSCLAIQGTACSDYGENYEEERRLGEQNVGEQGLGQDHNEQN